MADKRAQGNQESLSIEVRDEVRGIDLIMTKIIKDRDVWKEFFRDPAGVFARMGFSKPLSDDQGSKYNRMFYAMLTDKRLLQYVHDGGFEPHFTADQTEMTNEFVAGLEEGKIEYDPEIDVDVINRMRKDPKKFGKLLEICLHRINEDGIFSVEYTDGQIDKCVASLVDKLGNGATLGEMARGMPWNGEVDDEFRVMAVVVPAIALPVVVQAVACGTLACVVIPAVEGGLAAEALENLQAKALQGEAGGIKALALLGSLLEFISELSDNLNEFERIMRN